jgi:UDPglucose--hexose-1-phosphate uridylyltransferase
MSEYRKDPITGRWVIIARHRAQRPRQFSASNNPYRDEPCPFCTGNEAMTPPEVWARRMPNTAADAPGWSVRVVPNKFPALDR